MCKMGAHSGVEIVKRAGTGGVMGVRVSQGVIGFMTGSTVWNGAGTIRRYGQGKYGLYTDFLMRDVCRQVKNMYKSRGRPGRLQISARLTHGEARKENGVRSGFRPKQSLGQNFLRDENVGMRIVESFRAAHRERGGLSRVVEVGPGMGALTGMLSCEYTDMVAIEIDRRAVEYLRTKHSGVDIRHGDVLETDWGRLSEEIGSNDGRPRCVSVIGNMPYNIVSQILFSLLDAPRGSIDTVVMMMQKEVGDRLVSPTRKKSYGILSVVAQLYGEVRILFPVDRKCFYPQPDVTSCVVRIDLLGCEKFDTSNRTLVRGLKQVIKASFGQRRKVLRNCLKPLCESKHVEVPHEWSSKRAEELTPLEFVQLTKVLFAQELAEHAGLSQVSDLESRHDGTQFDANGGNRKNGIWRN